MDDQKATSQEFILTVSPAGGATECRYYSNNLKSSSEPKEDFTFLYSNLGNFWGTLWAFTITNTIIIFIVVAIMIIIGTDTPCPKLWMGRMDG